MFGGCVKLKTVYVSDKWDNTKIIKNRNSFEMFELCTSLVGGQGTKYNVNHTDNTYAKIDGGSSAPGYMTYKPSPIERCDVNGDGKLNSDDVKLLEQYIMNQNPKKITMTKVDLNEDGVVNVADVVWLVNIIKSR